MSMYTILKTPTSESMIFEICFIYVLFRYTYILIILNEYNLFNTFRIQLDVYNIIINVINSIESLEINFQHIGLTCTILFLKLNRKPSMISVLSNNFPKIILLQHYNTV